MGANHIDGRRDGGVGRTLTVRGAMILGLAILGIALAPAALAFADDDQPTSPATPIIQSADRGSVMSGVGEERIADMGKIQGGGVSKAAPMLVKDGSLVKLPVIKGEAGMVCSKQQNIKSAMIPCFG